MKKITILILSIMMVGCSSENTKKDDKVYKDGTFSSVADGYGGEFNVDVMVKDDKITDVLVKENNETPSIGGVALTQLISSIKEKNTYDVDVVSGATKTSQALKEAVKEALENAKKDK